MITIRKFLLRFARYNSFKPTLSKLKLYLKNPKISLETELEDAEERILEEWINVQNHNIPLRDNENKSDNKIKVNVRNFPIQKLLIKKIKRSPPPFNPDQLKPPPRIIVKKR